MAVKCFRCGCNTNKDNAKFCSKCGQSLTMAPAWLPDVKWHIKTLGIIYVILLIVFIVGQVLLKPYVRNIVENW
ncbi:MAG: zinc ribbon domain-containing protein [Elusimicrobiota bacterium]